MAADDRRFQDSSQAEIPRIDVATLNTSQLRILTENLRRRGQDRTAALLLRELENRSKMSARAPGARAVHPDDAADSSPDRSSRPRHAYRYAAVGALAAGFVASLILAIRACPTIRPDGRRRPPRTRGR